VTNVKVIQAGEFIRARADGRADLAKAQALLKAIVAAGEGIEGFDVLVDIRRVTPGTALTANELWQLADQLVHYRKTFAHKTAIVCPKERFGRSAFFALCAQGKGFNIRAFADYGDAMDWLLGDELDQGPIPSGGSPTQTGASMNRRQRH
jgi:hypothetical protein